MRWIVFPVFASAVFSVSLPVICAFPVSAADALAMETTAKGVGVFEKDGVTRISYDLRPEKAFMFGNYPRVGTDVDLWLREPLPGRDCCRFFFEAKGVRVDGKDVPSCAELRVVLEDSEGEVFDYLPHALPGLKRADRRYLPGAWDAYATGNWYAGEAGAVSHDLCVRVSGKGNGRPDGEMKVLGFRLHVACPNKAGSSVANLKGEILLAGCRAAARYSAGYPFVYADSLCRDAGRYRFRAAVATDFQGVPAFGVDETFDFRPGDRRRLEIPVPEEGMYWMRWELSDAATGERIDGEETRREVRGLPAAAVGRPAEFLSVSGGDRGAFGPDEPYRLRVAVPAELAGATVDYVLKPYYFTDELAAGTVPDDGWLSFPRDVRYNVFRLQVRSSRDGQTLERTDYLFGTRTVRPEKHDFPGFTMTRGEIKRRPYNRLSLAGDKLLHDQRLTYDQAGDLVRKAILDHRDWIQHYTVCPAINHTEVLPGVWDFSLLDLYLDTLAAYGCAATVRPCHSDRHEGPYRWTHSGAQYSYDGEQAGIRNPYGSYCGNDPAIRKIWMDHYRALYDRYRDHSGFEGYYLMDPAGESVVLDEPWAGILAGYGPAEQRGFREAMERKYGDISRLNAAWGASLAAFDEVRAPVPSFELGVQADVRPVWVDFMQYKASLRRLWAETLVGDIRSYDTNRVVIGYFPPTTEWLYGLMDYGHNGGNHWMERRGEYQRGWLDGGIGWITEPHHPHGWAANANPGKQGWTLDASVWTMLAQAGGGGANLHVYVQPEIGGALALSGGFHALDRMQCFVPLLKEVHDATLVLPVSDIAFHSDRDTLWTKHRTVFGPRHDDLRRWRKVIENDGFQPADLAAFPNRAFKLVCPNVLDETISEESFRRYVALVTEQGAKMVITARTGRYVSGRAEEFALLKALGITPPTGEWRMMEDWEAVAGADNPLMEEGRRFGFQTLTRLDRELHDEKVMSDFWRYPYKWIPQTDYFGCYPHEHPNGKTVATFASTGGTAMSVHRAGRGEVVVYWGLPSMSFDDLKGTIAAAARWAGIRQKPAPVPDFFEMSNPKANRHYGFFFRECAYGEKTVVFPTCPDGTYFADEMVTQRKLGLFTGSDLREKGVSLVWEKGLSPLRAVRLIANPRASWTKDYGSNLKE